MFTPITSRHHVPDEGTGFESTVLDLKAHPDAYKDHRDGKRVWNEFELAKDVAAFANSLGGTILLGAKQDSSTGACSGHAPFAQALVPEFERVLRDALKNRCGPRPTVQLDLISFGRDVMVAVNIWGFPGQVVAVEVRADKKRDWYGDAAYVFPVRMLSHTTFLSAEQIPMLMNPDARRAAILLSMMPSGATITVHPKIMIDADQHVRPSTATFVRVDDMKNCLVLRPDANALREVGVPLDELLVWYEGDSCHVRCDRRLVFRQ